MKAAWYERNGTAQEVLQFGELEKPAVGVGEVLVRVYASGVNPTDVWARGDDFLPFPRIVPHNDGAGIIEAVGDGVDPARKGERVWLFGRTGSRAHGTAAEYTSLPSEQAVPLPANASFAEGAGLGVPAMTAHRCLFFDGPVVGQTVLVSGGAGGVGLYAIQFAKWGKAKVIATVSSDAKAGLALEAGADYVVNYKTKDVAAQVEEITEGKGVHRIIEVAFGANQGLNLKILKENGVISTYDSAEIAEPRLNFYPFLSKSITIHIVLVFVMPQAARQQAIWDITEALKGGQLKSFITQRYSLAKIAAAHKAVESGHMAGKAIIEIV